MDQNINRHHRHWKDAEDDGRTWNEGGRSWHHDVNSQIDSEWFKLSLNLPQQCWFGLGTASPALLLSQPVACCMRGALRHVHSFVYRSNNLTFWEVQSSPPEITLTRNGSKWRFAFEHSGCWVVSMNKKEGSLLWLFWLPVLFLFLAPDCLANCSCCARRLCTGGAWHRAGIKDSKLTAVCHRLEPNTANTPNSLTKNSAQREDLANSIWDPAKSQLRHHPAEEDGLYLCCLCYLCFVALESVVKAIALVCTSRAHEFSHILRLLLDYFELLWLLRFWCFWVRLGQTLESFLFEYGKVPSSCRTVDRRLQCGSWLQRWVSTFGIFWLKPKGLAENRFRFQFLCAPTGWKAQTCKSRLVPD